ncbi:MAG: XrtA system polysaccharide chain length determinant [Pseudomonadota bacterium]
MSTEVQSLRRTLVSYINLFHRLKEHRRLILRIASGGAVLSIAVAFLIPRVYQSSTLIMVQSQKLPSSYVQSAISVDLGERLRTLTPQIMSRARLEQIIQKFDLYGAGNDPKEMERKVDSMRKAIDIQVKGEDTFRIYFKDRSPQVAQKVTEDLARLFIAENLRDRAQQALSTSEFLDSELQDLKRQLERQEASLRFYKEKHLGVLPEQQNANLRALDRFQGQYQANGEALQAAREQKAAIEGQISKENNDGLFVVPSEPQLEKLRAELGEKRAQLTDRHPDVRALVHKIDEMEKKLSNLQANGSTQPSKRDPYTQSILDKQDQVNHEIARLETDQQTLTENINQYQGRIESLPGVEEKLTLLTRDYETTRANYQALLNKKFEARLSMNLEKKQKDEAYKILDPAYLPVAPASPARALIVIAGFIFSMLAGLGTAFVIESLDTTIRDEADLENISKVPVIAVIPNLDRIGTSGPDHSERQATG